MQRGVSYPILPALTPAAPEPQASAGQVHAVRVGWFPGVYDDLAQANRQTLRYPLSEQQSFATKFAAGRWLAEPSARKSKDAETRPKTFGNIDRGAFLHYVARTWAGPNRLPGIEGPDMARKLRELFKQACEREDVDVDWISQPLPQTTLSRELDLARKTGRQRIMGL